MVQHNTHFTQYKVAQLLRAGRKRANLSQAFIASKLAITQGALSKMEHGIITPSAPQWFEFCRATQISPDSLMTGYIESDSPDVYQSDALETGYRLDSRFLKHRGLKVRLLLPLVKVLKKQLGQEAFDMECKKSGIDPDIFLDRDLLVNILVFVELFQMSKEHNIQLQAISQASSQSILQKAALNLPQTEEPFSSQLSAFVNSLKLLQGDFELNYLSISPHHSKLIVRPLEHLKKVRKWKPEDMGDELCKLFQTVLTQFSQTGAGVQLSIEHPECLYSSGKQCVYHLQVNQIRQPLQLMRAAEG